MMNMFRSKQASLEAHYKGRSAVITGAGSGMGRQMAVLLCKSGIADLSICDLGQDALEETVRLCNAAAPGPCRVSSAVVNVTDEAALDTWAEAFKQGHQTQHLNFLIVNAGIAGGNEFLETPKATWDRVFNVDLHGVVNTVRSFIHTVIATPTDQPAGITTLSSLCGYWACMGQGFPNSPYVTAKFAVRGFTESLMMELSTAAPHVTVTCVHPGHVGTDIVNNIDQKDFSTGKTVMEKLKKLSFVGLKVPDTDDPVKAKAFIGEQFRDAAPVTASGAAMTILYGMACRQTRVIVGADAHFLDFSVRQFPRAVYSRPFFAAYEAFNVFRALTNYFLNRPLLLGGIVSVVGAVTGRKQIMARLA